MINFQSKFTLNKLNSNSNLIEIIFSDLVINSLKNKANDENSQLISTELIDEIRNIGINAKNIEKKNLN